MRDFEEVIDEGLETLYNPAAVGKLVMEKTTDYERGLHAGKIWFATWIAREMASNDEEMSEDEIITHK